MPYSIAGAILLTIPALVFIDRFDFQAQPGGLVYIGTYIAVIIVALLIYFGVGARQARPTQVSL
jgi:hypothetical protein